MRRAYLLSFGTIALAAGVACATSDDEGATLLPVNDAGATAVPEAESPSGDAAADDGPVRPPSPCNDAGWCATELPDPDLVLKDIWPFEERAFAIAESDSLGTKVLEWTESTKSWAYVDDNSQNAYGSGHYAGKVWAPSETEIYYTTAPALVYRGTRATPGSPFSWESTRLEYEGPDLGPDRDPGRPWRRRDVILGPTEYVPALGVWGTSGDDVYAWYGSRIFHRKSVDGGAPTWVAEHVEEDVDGPEESFYIFGAAGSSRDDVWFVGSHGRYDPTHGLIACSTLIRRTPDGYTRVMDHALTSDFPGSYACMPKPESLALTFEIEIPGWGTYSSPWTETGWATSVDSPRPGTAVALVNHGYFAFVDTAGPGMARYNFVAVNTPTLTGEPNLQSVWIHEDRAWFSGWGLVIDSENNPDSWARCYGLQPPEELAQLGIDGGAKFSVSSTTFNGTPLDRPLYQVRGSSNKNLWAVGPRYALHKKTP